MSQASLFDPFPAPDEARVGKVGHRHPATSREAAYLCRPSFASQRAVVLVAVAVAGEYGVTVAAIADAMGVSRNQIATRMGELREQGWVKRAVAGIDVNGDLLYRQRATGPSTHGIVHVLNPAAKDEFDRWVDEGAK